MTQYILFIHGNETSKPAAAQWDEFFAAARLSGLFEGGSEIGQRVVLGDSRSAKSSEPIVGYMRFDAEDRQTLLKLLEKHPVVLHGGTVELCELPKS
jgi:hypothetical protein